MLHQEILFSTRTGTTDIPSSERMRITSYGDVGIQTTGYVFPNNYMSARSLTIGNNNQNYGGGGSSWNQNTVGLMMECADITEIAIHDSGASIHSFMYYSTNGQFFIGRNMGHGVATTQFMGVCKWAANTWNTDSAGILRIYFGDNSIFYLSGGTSVGGSVAFEFRRATDQFTVGYITNTGFIYMYGFAGLSDRRIKKDIEDIDDVEGLNKLLLVKPTKYNYVDESRNKGFGKVFGFIAQQIREVIPEAISIQSQIIPNIKKKCLIYNKREIYHSIPQDVAIDTEVSITIDGKGKRYKIKEIYGDYFVIDEDIDADEAFVEGYKVDDLHYIDKDHIFTLNVCATQELHSRIEAQDKHIKELETKSEKLINYIYQ